MHVQSGLRVYMSPRGVVVDAFDVTGECTAQTYRPLILPSMHWPVS